MTIQPRFRRILRKAGGMFIGLKIHMPCSIFEDYCDGQIRNHYTMLSTSFGFLFWQLDLDFCYNFRTEDL